MQFRILQIKKLGEKGRGIVAGESIPAGEKIERCPVLALDKKYVEPIDHTPLYDYYFIWGEDDSQIAIVLGYGSLYNHSFEPNAEYVPNYKEQYLEFFALKNIDEGEEITVNYNGAPESKKKLWFNSK